MYQPFILLFQGFPFFLLQLRCTGSCIVEKSVAATMIICICNFMGVNLSICSSMTVVYEMVNQRLFIDWFDFYVPVKDYLPLTLRFLCFLQVSNQLEPLEIT